MLEKVKIEVAKLLDKDNSGHGMDHINRVLNMSLRFALEENANKEIVALIALLHDVDDYKLFGMESQENLTNAKKIMKEANVNIEIQKQVCDELRCIGYSKRLKGFVPRTIEGKIVSDADMCDGLGATGIIRIHSYGIKNGRPFFDKNIFPIDNISAEQYTSKNADTSVCHIFEKILKLKYLMLTNAGSAEAEKRHQFIINFLYNYFTEENVPEWIDYMDNIV